MIFQNFAFPNTVKSNAAIVVSDNTFVQFF